MNTIKRLLTPTKLNSSLFKLPADVKRTGIKIQFWQLFSTIMTLAFAYLLRFTNLLIEHEVILLGIIIFMIYKSQNAIRNGIRIKTDSDSQSYDFFRSNELSLISASIMSKVANKILKFDKSSRTFKVMKNEEIIKTCNIFISSLWEYKINFVFKIIEWISGIIMLLSAIITNDKIAQVVFIPIIILFSLVSIISTIYVKNKKKKFWQIMRKTDSEHDIILNDLLRVPPIVSKDLDMRLDKIKETMVEASHNQHIFFKKRNESNLLVSIIEVSCQYLIILFYILNIDFASINLATIAEITASLAIVQTTMGYIRDITYSVDYNVELCGKIAEVEEDMTMILEKYEERDNKESEKITNIHINPFVISYSEESENDIPFTLISKNEIDLNQGDVLILKGRSGGGKSTFIKMLTDRICTEGTSTPKTTRCLYFDESLKFGSLSLFDELFCNKQSNIDVKKMEDILKNLHLWQEISENSKDVWVWLKTKNYTVLSNGQKQRMILAKILYWLDDEIDVLALDEATSGLDELSFEEENVSAAQVIKYCIKMANLDKKRIVIISTHQNLSQVKKDLKNSFNFINLKFIKSGSENYIEF